MMQQQSCHETKWNWTVGWSPKYAEVDVRFPSHLQCNQLFGDLVHPGRRGRDRLLVQTFRKLLDRSKMYSRAPHTSQSCALTRSPWHRPQSQMWLNVRCCNGIDNRHIPCEVSSGLPWNERVAIRSFIVIIIIIIMDSKYTNYFKFRSYLTCCAVLLSRTRSK